MKPGNPDGKPDAGRSELGETPPPPASEDLVARLRRALAQADDRVAVLEEELEQWRRAGPERYQRDRAQLRSRLEASHEKRRSLAHELSVLRRHLRDLTSAGTAADEPPK